MHDHSSLVSHTINFPKFIETMAAADRHFARIKEKFPQLKGNLDVTLPRGQTSVKSTLRAMMEEFPELFLENEARSKAIYIIRELNLLEKKKESVEWSQRPQINEQIGIHNQRLQEISQDLIVNGNCRFEIQFHQLDYELIWRLRKDVLVDTTLTPQTRASIRIVLGPISRFATS